jgi:hypothetical protein
LVLVLWPHSQTTIVGLVFLDGWLKGTGSRDCPGLNTGCTRCLVYGAQKEDVVREDSGKIGIFETNYSSVRLSYSG